MLKRKQKINRSKNERISSFADKSTISFYNQKQIDFHIKVV